MTDTKWPRANPDELASFDPSTKTCTMNCGPHTDDPRSAAERKLLCKDCEPVQRPITPTMLALAMSEDGEELDSDDWEMPEQWENEQ